MIAKSRLLHQTKETILCATRYGNVMASRGSVIPLFIDQLINNKNLTITDPNMTRFLMSLDDSFDLVEFAFNNGQQGDIFVQKGKASTILNLATALKELFKKENPINILGTRHGEKLFEVLLSSEEMIKAIDEGNFFRVPVDARDLNYKGFEQSGIMDINHTVSEFNSNNAQQLTLEELIEIIKDNEVLEYAAETA